MLTNRVTMPTSRHHARSNRMLIFVPIPPMPQRVHRAAKALVTLAFGTPMLALQPPPLKHVPVRGDGRCLFRAIAKNLADAEGRRLSEQLERADADYLRKLAWKIICQRRRQEFMSRHVIEGSISRYCQISRNPTYYAGEPELLALSDELKIPIKIYLADGGKLRNIVTYGENYKPRSKPKHGDGAIRLLYSNGNHYDALLPR